MYHFSKILDVSFNEAIALVTKALKQEGFGVLTQIAYQMLQIEDKAGVLYPCNVVIQEHSDGRVEVSAIDPMAMFQDIKQPEAKEVAARASQKMQRVINSLNTAQLVA